MREDRKGVRHVLSSPLAVGRYIDQPVILPFGLRPGIVMLLAILPPQPDTSSHTNGRPPRSQRTSEMCMADQPGGPLARSFSRSLVPALPCEAGREYPSQSALGRSWAEVE